MTEVNSPVQGTFQPGVHCELPGFLIIGAQRAGTTWLWRHLKFHPEVWTPPVKELHYFDRSPAYPSPSRLAVDNQWQRLFGRGRESADYRRQFLASLVASLARRQWSIARWHLRYYLGSVSDQWYASLFAPAAGRLTGEATPAYALLDPADVARISNITPDVKIVFVLRNPIDRAWSQLRYDRGEEIRVGRLSVSQITEFIDSPSQTLRSDYQRTLHVWSAVFAPTPHLGLIVIDEEHESTFKQDSAPRYHARDVAWQRALAESIPLVLGSATPSLEAWRQAEQGVFGLLSPEIGDDPVGSDEY